HTRFSRDWSSDVCSSDLQRLRVEVDRRSSAGALMHPPTAGDPVADLPRQQRRRAAGDRTPERTPHLAHEAVAAAQLPTPHPHQGLEPLVLVVAFLFLLFLAAAEDAAEHVSRAQPDPDTRERVLTDLRLDVVADRAHLVRAEVLGAALQGVPHAVHCSADLAFQATLLFHRARPLLEPGAEPIHPAGQLLLAALDGTGGL